MNRGEPRTVEVAIIGAGFSGLGLGIKLRQAGIEDFVILEKASEVGGTWRENTYPGAECDIPSALYSYSFETSAEWDYKWAEQHQILDYLKHVAARHDLYAHIRFAREVRCARFDEGAWRIDTRQGEGYRARYLVTAVGQLHHPHVPAYPGASDFSGRSFHSARWDHALDLEGKRVGVIGNAASALQFIPQIAARVERLTVYQRSANWVIPKQDRPYRPWEQWLADRVPLLTRAYRLRLWLRAELLLYWIMRGKRWAAAIARRMNRRYLHRTIADPALRAALTPDYPIGAKRVLFSDDYYQALARPNVELVTAPIARFTATGIATADARERDHDVVIYGTGFKTNPFLYGIGITGPGGRTLHQAWRGGAHAHLGIMTGGFPNLFMLYGPNTNLGHNSIVIMSEAQARYIVAVIAGMARRGGSSVEVDPEVERAYNDQLQARLKNMVWSQAGPSWYKDGERITNNWPGTTLEYIRRTRRVNWEHLRVATKSSSATS